MSSLNNANDIIKCKYKANATEYFNLFEKHIQTKLVKKDIYIRDISNVDVLYNIIKKNPSNNYFINDAEDVFNILRIRCRIDFPKTNLIFYNPEKLDMKFDLIIMNPPYDGQTNLYGKITHEARRHAKKVVCLSPYLNYISNKKSFKKISNELNKYLEDFELCDTTLFNDAAFDKQLCIFTFGKNKIKDFNDLFWIKFSNVKLAKSILEKVKTKSNFCDTHTIDYKSFNKFNYKCVMTFKRGHFFINRPLWDWTTLFSEEFQTKFDWKQNDIKTPNCQAIPFESEIECKNFCKYCNSDIVAFIIYAYKVSLSQSSNLQYIPYMPTYEKEWTDQEIAAEIGLTNEELDYIYSEMKPFGWKTKNVTVE